MQYACIFEQKGLIFKTFVCSAKNWRTCVGQILKACVYAQVKLGGLSSFYKLLSTNENGTVLNFSLPKRYNTVFRKFTSSFYGHLHIAKLSGLESSSYITRGKFFPTRDPNKVNYTKKMEGNVSIITSESVKRFVNYSFSMFLVNRTSFHY